jgi:hypothetical protein
MSDPTPAGGHNGIVWECLVPEWTISVNKRQSRWAPPSPIGDNGNPAMDANQTEPPSRNGANGRASFSRDARPSERSAPPPTAPSRNGTNGRASFSRDARPSERSAPPPNRAVTKRH